MGCAAASIHTCLTLGPSPGGCSNIPSALSDDQKSMQGRGLIVASDHVQPFGSQHNLDKSGDWRNEGGSESESEKIDKRQRMPKIG
ncbi:hypothetical protein PspLS_08088 [Pyricularia sp. CBS 133598]|nr:hypothetical protein PspLS_08088 [Pyricularia sp. CBS 133598]